MLKFILLITVKIRFVLVGIMFVFFYYFLGVLTEGIKDILKRYHFFGIKPEDQQNDQSGQPGLEAVKDTAPEQGVNTPDHQDWTGYMDQRGRKNISPRSHPARCWKSFAAKERRL
ncbi:MAG: hypothetical protein HQK58_02930 [Deltaproteobacteria bacterium]|nr:hypothetical protein [Deltaproteobacteria bacterium]